MQPGHLDPEDVVNAIRVALGRHLLLAPLAERELVPLREWYDSTFKVSVNMRSWAYDTVCGRDFETRQPHFRGFVAFGKQGRVGAALAEQALRRSRPLLAFEDDEFVRGTQLVANQGGWSVFGPPLQGDAP